MRLWASRWDRAYAPYSSGRGTEAQGSWRACTSLILDSQCHNLLSGCNTHVNCLLWRGQKREDEGIWVQVVVNHPTWALESKLSSHDGVASLLRHRVISLAWNFWCFGVKVFLYSLKHTVLQNFEFWDFQHVPPNQAWTCAYMCMWAHTWDPFLLFFQSCLMYVANAFSQPWSLLGGAPLLLTPNIIRGTRLTGEMTPKHLQTE